MNKYLAGIVVLFAAALTATQAIAEPSLLGAGTVVMSADDVAPGVGEAIEHAARAAADGQWLLALGGVLWLAIAVLRSRWLLGRVDWFRSRIGGYVINGAVAGITVIAATLYAGESVSVSTFLAAASAAMAASGLHQTSKDVTKRSSAE